MAARVEQHIERFEEEKRRHLATERMLRSESGRDEGLDELSRAVLGLSGSAEILTRYQALAVRIGELAGEPIVKVADFRGQRVRRAEAGVIAGEVVLSSSLLTDQVPGSRSGYLKMEVPLAPFVSCHFPLDSGWLNVHNGSSVADNRITVAHLINREWGNATADPEADYTETEMPYLYIGRRAIYGAPRFSDGIGAVLLEVEDAARVANNAIY